MPPAVDPDGCSWSDLSGHRIQKSRSHLALFEAVERHGPHHRQTEHHNAFGYLGQSFFASSASSSCHQLVRGSPESLFWRLPSPEDRPRPNSRAGRNESSAIFAVLGVDKPHSPGSHAAGGEQLQRYAGQSVLSSPTPAEKAATNRHSYKEETSLSPLSFFSRPANGLDSVHPKTSTPFGHLFPSKSVLSVPTMSDNVSTFVSYSFFFLLLSLRCPFRHGQLFHWKGCQAVICLLAR